MSTSSTEKSNWSYTIARGPDWLFFRLHPGFDPANESFDLADEVWNLMQQHLVDRIVLEMDEVEKLSSQLIGQLVLLHKRVHSKGGIMRLSGLADVNQQALRMAQLEDRFPRYVRRDDAVRGGAPIKPR
jgi:anti-anti-sigma regulatory factor